MDSGGHAAESVANWFFRLNGCLTTANFVLHPNSAGSQLTDADILGVRFLNRREQDFPDHRTFVGGNRIDVVIGEVKRGPCALNGPWKSPENIQYVLGALGTAPSEGKFIQELHGTGWFEDELWRIRLFTLGSAKSAQLPKRVVQLTWNEVCDFIYGRFRHHRQKADHEQWDDVGSRLYDLANSSRFKEFESEVLGWFHPN